MEAVIIPFCMLERRKSCVVGKPKGCGSIYFFFNKSVATCFPLPYALGNVQLSEMYAHADLVRSGCY
jgi:hypothetical protein